MEAGLLQATPLGYLLSGSPLLVLGPRASSESLPHRCKISPLLRTKARGGGVVVRPSGERIGPASRMGRPHSGPGSHGLDMSGPTPLRRVALGPRGASPPDIAPPNLAAGRGRAVTGSPATGARMVGEQRPAGTKGTSRARGDGASPVPTGRVEEGPSPMAENRPRLLRTRRGCRLASQRRGKSGPALWEHPCQLDMRGREGATPRHSSGQERCCF